MSVAARVHSVGLEERHHFFFFNDTATTEIYTLSLHDALPILRSVVPKKCDSSRGVTTANKSAACSDTTLSVLSTRSEEHTSELQSRSDLVCRLLLEKKTLAEQHDASRRRRDHRLAPA